MNHKLQTVLCGLAVLLCACGGSGATNPPPPSQPVATATPNLGGTVVERRGGAPVVGATVRVVGSDVTAITDANGSFRLVAPASASALTIEKTGMAGVRVEGFDLQGGPVALEEVMRPILDPAIAATPPEVTLDAQNGQGFTDAISVRVQAKVATPDKNRARAVILSLGGSSGASGFLNRGSVRARDLEFDGDETVTLKGAGLAAHAGPTELHVVVYDFAENRTHLIRKVNLSVTPAAASANPAAATDVFATAITFPDYATFGALRVNPALGRQAAPEGALLWVTLDFQLDTDRLPASLEVLRSFDGTNFSVIGKTDPTAAVLTAVNPKLGFQFRDAGAALRPGLKTYYKIASVTGSTRAESPVAATTPLGRYSVRLVSPGALATGSPRTPTYRWESSGAAAHELARVIVLDRLHSESTNPIWLGPSLLDRNAIVHDADGRALEPRLQANHAYTWQLAAMTFSDERDAQGRLQPRAFSVAADLFGLFADLNGIGDPVSGQAFPTQTGPVAEFVTGGL